MKLNKVQIASMPVWNKKTLAIRGVNLWPPKQFSCTYLGNDLIHYEISNFTTKFDLITLAWLFTKIHRMTTKCKQQKQCCKLFSSRYFISFSHFPTQRMGSIVLSLIPKIRSRNHSPLAPYFWGNFYWRRLLFCWKNKSILKVLFYEGTISFKSPTFMHIQSFTPLLAIRNMAYHTGSWVYWI